VLTWDSPHGDLKRGAKFTKKSTNFNISMTGTDIAGLLDLNDTIAVFDDKGSYICTFTRFMAPGGKITLSLPAHP
jgi:hypothetical protein